MSAALGAALLACAGTTPPPHGDGCSKDTDCKGDRVCDRGNCGDARHTGRRAGPAPAKAPKELWTYAASDVLAGSPTVGPDGTIYITSHDGHLYAIGTDGAVKWKVKTGDRSWSTPAVATDGTI